MVKGISELRACGSREWVASIFATVESIGKGAQRARQLHYFCVT